MKIFTALILSLTLWLATVAPALSDQSQENGLLVYDEPPGGYVEVIRFSSIADGTGYATVISPNGNTRHCWNSGMIARVDYPEAFGAIDTPTASEHLQQIQSLLASYPQWKMQLQGALVKWQNALSLAKQTKPAQQAASPVQRRELGSLEVDGTKYENVTLNGVNGDSASIIHSDGAAMIKLDGLAQLQIASLNATSTTAHIDPDWKQKWKAVQASAKATEVENPLEQDAGHSASVNFAATAAPPQPKLTFKYLASEPFVVPEVDSAETPSYADTVRFLEGHLDDTKIGYGEASRMLIVRCYFAGRLENIIVCDPTKLSTDVKTYSRTEQHGDEEAEVNGVEIDISNGAKDVYYAYDDSGFHQNLSAIKLKCHDSVDAEKVAKAWSHLIEMLGGKKDLF
jgi:hypothetical protein